MKKMYLCSMATLMIAASATAQVRIGGEVGLNLNNLANHYQGETVSNQIKVGWHAGFLADFGLSKCISVQPGLRFSMKGGEETSSGSQDLPGGYSQWETKDKLTLDYIELPVNIVYRTGAPGTGRFMVGAGPYVALCVNAEDKFKSKTVTAVNGEAAVETVDEGVTDLNVGYDKGKDDIKPVDFGAQAFIGYELPMGLFVKGGGSLGLHNNFVNGSSEYKSKNYNFFFSLGYLFGGGK